MRRSVARLAASLIALGAGCSLTLGGTFSAYTATTTVGSNTFAAAADWTAPTVSSAQIGRASAYDTGSIKAGASYYVYANVVDSGSPASGIAGVTANVSTITAGASAAALTAGSYSAAGTTYNYRSGALTAGSSLTAGSYTYIITSTDKAGNAAPQSFTTTVDNTAPWAVDVQSTNVSGGTVGHFDQGDTSALTYSSVIDPYSILSGWTGAATNVQVALVDGGGSGSDSIWVYNTAQPRCRSPLESSR